MEEALRRPLGSHAHTHTHTYMVYPTEHHNTH